MTPEAADGPTRDVADLIDAHGGTYRSTHFASLVTARAAGRRT
jgi:hypothetical protein